MVRLLCCYWERRVRPACGAPPGVLGRGTRPGVKANPSLLTETSAANRLIGEGPY